jgi:hypothetical protein
MRLTGCCTASSAGQLARVETAGLSSRKAVASGILNYLPVRSGSIPAREISHRNPWDDTAHYNPSITGTFSGSYFSNDSGVSMSQSVAMPYRKGLNSEPIRRLAWMPSTYPALERSPLPAT